MKGIKLFSLILGLVASSNSMAYGLGQSSYPLMIDSKAISTEFTGIVSTGGGVGLQARYTQKLNSKTIVDAGLGISGGERSSRLFAGMDYEILPDYGNQPKFTLKGSFESAKEFNTRLNIIGLAPTISKGFSFWGQEAYPFLALPIGIGLESESKTYSTRTQVSTGITGKLPIEGYRHLTGSLEANFNLSDSHSSVIIGLAYPLD